MRWTDYDTTGCSIGQAVEVLGDRWTILVLRDVFNGVHRFDALREHLGVSRDILTKRLAVLVAEGVLERRSYQAEGQRGRAEYHLTSAGRDLQPVLVALLGWGEAHRRHPDGPPNRLEHRGCGGEVRVSLTCSEGHRVEGRDVVNVPSATARRTSS